jgi:hypothetical protein
MPASVRSRRADCNPPRPPDSLSIKPGEHQRFLALPEPGLIPTVRARPAARVLIRPEPGFYVMRLARGAPLVPALIYQLCPMVMPQPSVAGEPHPDDWCRPLDRSPKYRAQIDGKPIAIDQVWTARSLRAISPAEYQFRIGELRQWARVRPRMPEARPQLRVNLAVLPPLF